MDERHRPHTRLFAGPARSRGRARPLALGALVALGMGCTDSLLQALPQEERALDDRLALRGRVCTGTPDPTGFPVKVVFLVDKSGSMCVSDGPGSQSGSGFCQTIGNRLRDMGITVPGRVRALKELIGRFRSQPNVYVAIDPFESKIDSALPPGQNGVYFLPASQIADGPIEALQANLGKGTDYQGALAQAYWRIESDILQTNPQLRPRTRYVVVLLTDGAPYPRCSAADDLPPERYATAEAPWGVWRDNPEEFCNATDAGEYVPGFVGGAERNQNYQLFDAVDRLAGLRDKHNVGDIRLHTILLFNEQAAELCGAPCMNDLYNGLTPSEARQVATWTLRQLAEVHGGGTFQEFVTAASIELGALDYGSLASRFAVKTLLARNVHALPGPEGPELDSDADGLPDTVDGRVALGTERFAADSDEDGFSDAFEAARRAQGFDPLVVDPRGCRGVDGAPARYSCADLDGDGLSQAAEAYLGTDETLFDTDGDGLPDGVEVELGLDPLTPADALEDRDLDGVPDRLEVLQHSHPLIDDRALHAREGYRYELSPEVQEDGSTCYAFLVSNIRLLTPAAAVGQVGRNLITLTFAEAPESNLGRDLGVWKTACVFAQYAPPSLRVPAGPEIVLEPQDFHPPALLKPERWAELCKGAVP